MSKTSLSSDELMHYGVLGMKWALGDIAMPMGL